MRVMTTTGGIGHTLPYLIPSFRTATAVAVVVVAIELLLISWIRNRYMDTPFLRAAFQVIVGGVLVFLAGIWIAARNRLDRVSSIPQVRIWERTRLRVLIAAPSPQCSQRESSRWRGRVRSPTSTKGGSGNHLAWEIKNSAHVQWRSISRHHSVGHENSTI